MTKPTQERCPLLAGTGTALPLHRFEQHELAQVTRRMLPGLALDDRGLRKLFERTCVKQRFLALPVDEYARLSGLQQRNDTWLELAVQLTERAAKQALDAAGIAPAEIGMVMSVTSTGIAVPSLEARLLNRLPFSSDVKRLPLFGLGCLGGAAGVARAAEYVRAFPEQAALIVAVELCSLTLQQDDLSTSNLIAMGLFGDGAAAAVLKGPLHARAQPSGPRVVDSLSMFFPDTERLMGWDVVDRGFKLVLGREIPALARDAVPELVDRLLARHGRQRADVKHWIVHPGGPAVLRALCEGLGIDQACLAPSWSSLAQQGNLSSVSVLFLLDEFLRARSGRNELALMLALGPGFCGEAVLLRG